MLIHLDAALRTEILEAGSIDYSAITGIQNIAQARAQGDHIVTADIDLLKDLISMAEFGPSTTGVLRKILSEQSQFGALRHKLSTYISVNSLSSGLSSHTIGTQQIIIIPLARFQRNDITQPTFFVAENLLDCQLLIKFSSWYAKRYKNGVTPSKLKATLIPGGGDTTDRVLHHLIQEQRYLTLGITDSDQKFPGGPKGQTTRKCNALTHTEITSHKTLPVKSIENLLTFGQMEEVLNTDRDRHALKLRLERVRHLSNTDAWKYFPFKDGITDIHGPCKSNSLVAYWRGNVSLEEQPIFDEFVLPPLTSKILQWTLAHLEHSEPVCIQTDSVLFNIWEDLSLMIASWTCGSEPIRV